MARLVQFILAFFYQFDSFEKIGNQTKVKQTMQYEMKFGVLGKIMDAMVVHNQSDKGIKKFFAGLKSFTEKN